MESGTSLLSLTFRFRNRVRVVFLPMGFLLCTRMPRQSEPTASTEAMGLMLRTIVTAVANIGTFAHFSPGKCSALACRSRRIDMLNPANVITPITKMPAQRKIHHGIVAADGYIIFPPPNRSLPRRCPQLNELHRVYTEQESKTVLKFASLPPLSPRTAASLPH